MENDVDIAVVEGVIFHLLGKVFVVHVIVELQALEIAALAAVCEVVDDEDVVDAAVIELFYNIAADKTGTTCYNFHSFPSFTNCAILFTSPVVE